MTCIYLCQSFLQNFRKKWIFCNQPDCCQIGKFLHLLQVRLIVKLQKIFCNFHRIGSGIVMIYFIYLLDKMSLNVNSAHFNFGVTLKVNYETQFNLALTVVVYPSPILFSMYAFCQNENTCYLT